MSGPQLPDGVGFALAVPPSWWEFDVDPATREGALERMLTEQVRDVPEPRPHRTALARLLRQHLLTLGLTRAGRGGTYARPSGYRVGVRQKVWDDAVEPATRTGS